MATETLVDVVMPQMGVSVSEGTITRWMKSPGDSVDADEVLLEISTDKVDTEVPSPAAGVVQEILVQEGETVEVGTKIATIASGAAAAGPAEPEAPSTPEPVAAQPPEAPAAPAPPPTPPPPAEPVTEPTPTAQEDGRDGGKFVSPVVARIASEHGVDLGAIQGTGRGGRVTKKDILSYIEMQKAPPAAPAEPVVPAAPPTPAPTTEPAEAPPKPAPTPPKAEPTPAPPKAEPTKAPEEPELLPGEAIERMTPMRKGIAEHMRRSLDTAAHVTTTFEIDMSRVVELRQRLRREYEKRHGLRLTYLPFIARATVAMLAEWPWMNAEIRNDQIVTKSYVNLGIAVALDGGKGLIVPVVKNAEGMNLLGLTRAIIEIADKAREKRLVPDDVQGGTFTITNPGGYGAIHGTPIISQPQAGILDVEALVKRPVVVTDDQGNDAIAIRPMMNLCLSYDHRLVDGAYAAQFMRDLKNALQSWDENQY